MGKAGETHVSAVLVVEDDHVSGYLLKALLERSPLPVSTVEIVERLDEAIGALAKTAYDLALLDLNLPDSRGADTVTAVVNTCPDLAIVVVTGEYDEDQAVNMLALGAQDYLVKGQYSTNALIRTIRYALARKQAEWAARAACR
ncbi:response regulator [Sedimentisphaerales bacterium M17dextr]|uniref:Response regulator n=2 Tax=Anaerobaca lacustris TaxID=3044600 RepID=A0AAW6U4V5_9BACT|nr:response regulator [Sedimentisphaerales bacterium M17dextr]